jgi:hypothetical protein
MLGIFSLLAFGASQQGRDRFRASLLDGFRTFNHDTASGGGLASPAPAFSGPPQDVFERSG